MKGSLYLIPSAIGETEIDRVIPLYVKDVVAGIRHYIVENERNARRMLIKLGIPIPIDELKFYILNKHTDASEIPEYLVKLQTEDIGLLSDAGVPAIADPGSEVVELAHRRGIKVIPLVGPSSILLAMMASGLNGQNFAFNGYLPVKSHDRLHRLKKLEARSLKENQSQLFIEAPYRNNQLFKDILIACASQTLLCVAVDITLSTENIQTCTVSEWKKKKTDLHKKPVIYILHAKK